MKTCVHPGVLIVFTTNADAGDDSVADSPGFFFSKVKTSIVDDRSMLPWADKETWETCAVPDPQDVRERDWFRIGFEPMFVDYTKSETWFVLFPSIEVRPVYITSVIEVRPVYITSVIEVRPVYITSDRCALWNDLTPGKDYTHIASTNFIQYNTICRCGLSAVRTSWGRSPALHAPRLLGIAMSLFVSTEIPRFRGNIMGWCENQPRTQTIFQELSKPALVVP